MASFESEAKFENPLSAEEGGNGKPFQGQRACPPVMQPEHGGLFLRQIRWDLRHIA
jgi:hypothetical protein